MYLLTNGIEKDTGEVCVTKNFAGCSKNVKIFAKPKNWGKCWRGFWRKFHVAKICPFRARNENYASCIFRLTIQT
jgi:hypothetical protein